MTGKTAAVGSSAAQTQLEEIELASVRFNNCGTSCLKNGF